MALKHKNDLSVLGALKEDVEVKQGLSIGAVWVVYTIARQLGIEKVLGTAVAGKLALWQVIARVIAQGSCLSSVRLAQSHACCDILGIKEEFNEDHLYKNLAWLSENQKGIEKRLFTVRRGEKKPELFLYDVTSSYFEGLENESADWGYNRDKKSGKKQVVIGLLCDEGGEPVSIEVFSGNTCDTETFGHQVKKAAKEFGCSRVTFVGDRGMIKSGGIKELRDEDFYYITAISKPQIEKLINGGVLQMELFDEKICEVEDKESLDKEAKLDGCYVIKSNLSKEVDKQIIHDRYKDLCYVEHAFRTCKTGMLEMRPWYVRSKESTRGHALVVMLAYLIIRRLQEVWADLEITVEEGLKQLSTLCSMEVMIKGEASYHHIPTPRSILANLLKSAGISLPKVLSHLGVNIVSRKKPGALLSFYGR